MKQIAYMILFGLFACTPLVFAQDDAPETTTKTDSADTDTAKEDEEAEPEVDEKALKKAANRYWQTKMAKKKKALSIIKKVKDQKSSKKAAKQLVKLYNLDGKSKKETKKPEDSEFMDAAEKRFASHIEKLDEQIEEEEARISELDNTAFGSPSEGSGKVMNDDLAKGIQAALK